MKKFLLKVFFCISSLSFASETITIPFQFQTGFGFEESTIKASFKDNGETVFSQVFDNLKFVKVQGKGFTIQKSVYFSVYGSYGDLGYGSLTETAALPDFISSSSYTKGYNYQLGVELGYKFYLSEYHLNEVTLMPTFGLARFYTTIQSQNNTSFLTERWQGPYLGAVLEILTYQGFSIALGYNYCFLSFLEKTKAQFPSLALQSRKNFSSGYGHNPSIEANFYISKSVQLGTILNYYYFKQKKNGYPLSPSNLSVSGNFQLEDLSIFFLFSFHI